MPRRLVRGLVSRALLGLYSFMTYRSYEIVFGAILQDWQPDVIHAHDGVTLPTAARAASVLGAKLVFDSHELEVHRNPPLSWLKRRQVQRMERRYLPRADKVMTVTNLLADHLAEEYRIKRPTVVFNAPPAKVEHVHERWDVLDRTDLRTEMHLKTRKFVFVYTGQATLNRSLELAIIALSKLQGFEDPNCRFDNDYRLVTVGGVQQGHDAVLRRLADTYGVSRYVRFLPPVAPQRVAKYISTANASIIPIIPVTLSYEYAMPNKLFEAMLSGNPIIGSDLMEMAPFIAENRLGLTYRADSPDDCVEKMIELITRFPEFERSAEHQSKLAQEYAWEAQEKKLLAMYDDMLANSRHASSANKGHKP
jgi:glycogen synthase